MNKADLENIENHKKLLREQVENILKEEVEAHANGECDCDKKRKGEANALCYAGMWQAGMLSDKQVLEDRVYHKPLIYK